MYCISFCISLPFPFGWALEVVDNARIQMYARVKKFMFCIVRVSLKERKERLVR